MCSAVVWCEAPYGGLHRCNAAGGVEQRQGVPQNDHDQGGADVGVSGIFLVLLACLSLCLSVAVCHSVDAACMRMCVCVCVCVCGVV